MRKNIISRALQSNKYNKDAPYIVKQMHAHLL